MQLRTSIVAMVVAAAAGAAGARALSASHPGSAPVARAVTFASSPASELGKSADGARSSRRPIPPVASAVVYVAGAVSKPGVYALAPAARVADALRAAGGATAQADLPAVNLAERVEDGEEVAVPVRGAEAVAGGVIAGAAVAGDKHRRHHSQRGLQRKRHRRKAAPAAAQDGGPVGSADVPTETVDVNAADAATLETLPGIGPSLAQRLIAFRDLNGPFASSDELLDVGGMTAGKVDAIAPYVSF